MIHNSQKLPRLKVPKARRLPPFPWAPAAEATKARSGNKMKASDQGKDASVQA